MTTPQFDIRPSLIKGDPADAYLHWTKEVMRLESLNPKVLMDFSASRAGVLCGVEEAKALLLNVLPKVEHDSQANNGSDVVQVWAMEEGEKFEAGEPVLRVISKYASFGLCECVESAGETTVIAYGARHIHPNVAHILDYASVIGGCSSVSTILGSKHAGRNPLGNMPHSLPLLFGDTVAAAQAFDKHIGMETQRIVVVDTFKDEAEESLNVAEVLRDRLRGIRLDTPAERGGVTPMLVREIRNRLDHMNFKHVEIYVSGGFSPEKIREFREYEAPVNGYLVGSYISSAVPNEFRADILEIEDKPIAKRGRVPGRLDGNRLDRIL